MLQDAPMYAYIPAKDVARARKFYEEKLSFKPKEETAGGVVYEFGKGTACFLYSTPNAGTSQASQAFWHVNNIDREVADLKARGVNFEKYDIPGNGRERYLDCGWCQGCVVQGHRRKHYGTNPERLSSGPARRPAASNA